MSERYTHKERDLKSGANSAKSFWFAFLFICVHRKENYRLRILLEGRSELIRRAECDRNFSRRKKITGVLWKLGKGGMM